MPNDDLLRRDRSEYDKQLELFEKNYWTSVNGAFPICHQGCALRILLVVRGVEAGHVWEDRRSEHAGLMPIRLKDGSRATFAAWYEEWLDDCLAFAMKDEE
jgi:hypothetical protein